MKSDEASIAPPRVFISYAWESLAYRLWVKSFAARLRQDGVNARLDAWDLEEGTTIVEFMSREIRQADKVLILGSPQYKEKVHAMEDGLGISGIGWENMLLTVRAFSIAERKIIPSIAMGTRESSIPEWLLGYLIEDLSDAASFEDGYHDLYARLTDQREESPQLGRQAQVRFTEIRLATAPYLRGSSATATPISAGIDDISDELIRCLAEPIANLLAHFYFEIEDWLELGEVVHRSSKTLRDERKVNRLFCELGESISEALINLRWDTSISPSSELFICAIRQVADLYSTCDLSNLASAGCKIDPILLYLAFEPTIRKNLHLRI